ncbi:uncharacterized abhydrolase domain-containing protein DDB_G0269086-like isoform X2 [Planococcus citri]|uniref:uncharacterized abhydrolase domain-containing protein DDB_G0269086-like isoform X2 n=1 Tax=Planococcus citri TaxID=170843 RepID=UPI0031F98FCE
MTLAQFIYSVPFVQYHFLFLWSWSHSQYINLEMLALEELKDVRIRRAEAEKQLAEAKKQRAEAEKQRAEAEKQRAEAEKQLAEAKKQRAEAEKQRAEAEAEKKRLEEALRSQQAETDKIKSTRYFIPTSRNR